MKSLKTAHQGFSIIEVLIASAIFSFVIISYIQLRGLLFEQERKVDDTFNQIKVLMTIKDEILKDDAFIIPYEVPVGSFTDDTIFDDRAKSGFRCYDKDASIKVINYSDTTLDLAKACSFQVAFYKLRVRVPGKSVSPISQYHIRVKYFVGAAANMQEELVILRPFVTNVQYN